MKMNKIALKAITLSLSAALFTSTIIPSSYGFLTSTKVAAVEAGVDEPVEQIKNVDFEDGYKFWNLYLDRGEKGVGGIKAVDGELELTVSSVGGVNYAVQLYYDNVHVYQKGQYILEFDVRSDIPRDFEAMIQMNGGEYTSYCWTLVSSEEEVQHIEVPFTMKAESDETARLCFNCGIAKSMDSKDLPEEHHIYFDNVSVKLVDDTAVDYTGFITDEDEAGIMTNQVGYLPSAKKEAIFRGEDLAGSKFAVKNAADKTTVYEGKISEGFNNRSSGETLYSGDFSAVETPGTYYISVSGLKDSYPFTVGEDVYDDLLESALHMLYLQRCGCEVNDETFGHKECHTSEAKIYGTDKKIDVSGGWHDAGDYGRYIVPAAKTVADLLLAYEANPSIFTDDTNIPESGNKIADILDEAKYELDWMLKMQDKETGGVYHKVSCANFPGFVMPDKETGALIVTPVSTTATADFCAAMAMAYDSYKEIDKEFAEKCLEAAKSAWGFLEANPDLIFKNPEDIGTGEYGDKFDTDERYWAAAQMYKATGDAKYAEAFADLYGSKGQTGMDWSTVGMYGNLAYLSLDEKLQDAEMLEKVLTTVKKDADSNIKYAGKNIFGTAINTYYWGCNMGIANSGVVLAESAKLFEGTEETDVQYDYAISAAEQLNYLLGKNALGTSFVTGFGTIAPKHPHHRPSVAMKKAVPGMVSGGVNPNLEDPAAEGLLAEAPEAKCWIDNDQSYSTNEVTIYWNSPLIYLLAEIMDSKDSSENQGGTDEIIYGDFNGDKVADLTDLTTLSLYLLGDIDFSASQLTAADVDGNDKVDIADLARFKQYVSKDPDVKVLR